MRRVAMMLIMLPMWMNFLLRTYAWMSILENTGLLNRFFDAIGLFDLINGLFGTEIEYFKMINTQARWCWAWCTTSCLHDPAHLLGHRQAGPPADRAARDLGPIRSRCSAV